MKAKTITGVSRATKFSPNRESNDTLIFRAVSDILRNKGFAVQEISETECERLAATKTECFFSMARGTETLTILGNKEKQGAIVINSAQKLLCNDRNEITRLFRENNIPSPKSEILFGDDIPSLQYPFWIKRGDCCAQSRNDIRYIDTSEILQDTIKDFHSRHISKFVTNEHLAGDLVKFYGVAGTDFFYTYLPTDNNNFGKFGLEHINGKPHRYKYDMEQLHNVCTKAAALIGFIVYGGDCVINESGEFRIIDFNDWPSFSCCRDNAARAIADVVSDCCNKHINCKYVAYIAK